MWRFVVLVVVDVAETIPVVRGAKAAVEEATARTPSKIGREANFIV